MICYVSDMNDHELDIEKQARAQEIERMSIEAPSWDAAKLRKTLRSMARMTSTATVDGDLGALHALLDIAISSSPRPKDIPSSEFQRGVYETLAAVAGASVREIEARVLSADVEAGSDAHRMLVLIEQHPHIEDDQVKERMGETGKRIDQVGAVLIGHGLVESVGTPAAWAVTVRGERMLDAVGRTMPSAFT